MMQLTSSHRLARATAPLRRATACRLLSTARDEAFPYTGHSGHNFAPTEAFPPLQLAEQPNSVDLSLSRFDRHWEKEWSPAALEEAQRAHVGTTWAPAASLDAVPYFTRGEGVYLYDSDDKRYIDWTSQAICVNLGHSVPPAVLEAVTKQMTDVAHVYGGLGLVESRCRLSALLAELLPGDLTGLLFPSSGGEANEAAIRMARRYTGRPKILTQYRSYHGGTANAAVATGDFRREYAESGISGFVKALNPTPMTFAWGESEGEATQRALAALEEQIVLEGPDTIAAVLLESVVGSGGALMAQPDYMRGVRALCDRYGILYIADEVMVGFGRTGKMWGFQHFEGLLPDIVTSAKGLSSAYLPISMVAMSAPLHEYFRANAVGWGSTYHAHPVAVACAYECVKHMLEVDVVGNAARLEPTMVECTDRLVAEHPSVAQGRAMGLFGCLDLVTPDGRAMQPLRGPPHAALPAFKRALLDNGVFGLVRPPLLHTAPPLVINEAELRDGFDRVGRALSVLDKQLGF